MVNAVSLVWLSPVFVLVGCFLLGGDDKLRHLLRASSFRFISGSSFDISQHRNEPTNPIDSN